MKGRLSRTTAGQIRIRAGYDTAEEFAPLIRVSRGYWLLIEEGLAIPSRELVERAARKLGVSNDHLWRVLARERMNVFTRRNGLTDRQA